MIVRRCGITIARIGVARWHRRQPRVIGGLVAFEAVGADGWPVGVAIVGRPVSRHLQSRGLVEVTRVATDETRNACSMLYGACARWAKAQKLPIFTDTHADEGGASLRGAGWVVVSTRPAVKGKGWDGDRGRGELRPTGRRRCDGLRHGVSMRCAVAWCEETSMHDDPDKTDPHRHRPTGKNTLAVEKQKLLLEQRRIELAAEDRARDDRRAMVRQVIAAAVLVVALGLIGAALYWGRSFSFSGLGIEAQTGHAPNGAVE